MTLSYWQQEAQGPPEETDVAIVGGGIIGCSTAYWLKKLAPQLKVMLLESGRVGQGATGRNAGFVLQGTANDYLSDCKRYGAETTRRLWRLTLENRRLLEDELDGTAFDWEANGSLIIAGSEEEQERLHASVSKMRADGLSVVYQHPEEINDRLDAQNFFGGLYLSTGAAVNPLRLVRHIAEASGASIRERHHVLDLSPPSGASGAVLTTAGGRIRASRTLLAVNARAGDFHPALARYVRPVRAQMLSTESADRRRVKLPIYSHEGYFYLRQLASGAILAGGARHLHREEESGHKDKTTPALQADIEAYLRHHFPWASRLAVRGRWSGTMGFSPDGIPLVSRVYGSPDILWSGGSTGHGMGVGFKLGQLLAKRLARAETPDAWELFSAKRLQERARDAHFSTSKSFHPSST